MHIDLLSLGAALAFGTPVFAMLPLLAHYYYRRAVWRRRKRRGRGNAGFCPSAFALGSALQFLAIFYRPSLRNVLEARELVDVDEDDDGGSDTPKRHLHRQLRRIRRGEPVGDLVWRM
jgi:hypothetical protein